MPIAAHSALAPKEEGLSIAPALVKAIAAAQKLKNGRSLLQSYMASLSAAPTSTEISGLFRYFLTLRPLRVKQLALSMECLRFASRLGLADMFMNQMTHIKPWIDQVLVAALVKSRSRKTKDSVFIDLNLRRTSR